MSYNGYKSYSQWNQSLWINNDERLYGIAYSYAKRFGIVRGSAMLWEELKGQSTGDGVPYNKTGVRVAMAGIL